MESWNEHNGLLSLTVTYLLQPCLSPYQIKALTATYSSPKLSDLKQHKLIILQLWRSAVQNECYWAKIYVPARLCFLKALGNNSFYCLFQILQAVCIPCSWPLPSSKLAMAGQLTSITDTLVFCLPLQYWGILVTLVQDHQPTLR